MDMSLATHLVERTDDLLPRIALEVDERELVNDETCARPLAFFLRRLRGCRLRCWLSLRGWGSIQWAFFLVVGRVVRLSSCSSALRRCFGLRGSRRVLLSRWRTIVNLLLVLSLHRYIGLLLWLLGDSSSTLGGRLATALGWGRLVVFILLLWRI